MAKQQRFLLPLPILIFEIAFLVVAAGGYVWMYSNATNTYDRTEDIGVILFFVGLAWAFTAARIGPNDRLASGKGSVALGSLLVLTGFTIISGNYISKPDTWQIIQRRYNQFSQFFGDQAILVTTGILLFAGYLLYLLKIKKLSMYANLEIAFATISCWVAAQKNHGDLSAGTATVFGAAVYLVVRGFDNRNKAKSEVRA
jgi:hypothetical protein